MMRAGPGKKEPNTKYHQNSYSIAVALLYIPQTHIWLFWLHSRFCMGMHGDVACVEHTMSENQAFAWEGATGCSARRQTER